MEDSLLKEIRLECNNKIQKSLEFFSKDLSSLRTGRASHAMLSGIKVDNYGNLVPIEQVGTITIADSRTIHISVWDKSMVLEVETKIRESNLGINPVTEGTKIKLHVPPLTEESRKNLVKKAAEFAEKTRVSVRQVRKHILDSLKDLQKNKQISEDLFNTETASIEKKIKEANAEVDVILDKKNKELMSI